MTEIVWLLVAFVLLNVLDGFTTWLGIYKLPPELRGREANVLFKDVEKKFWPAMIKKGVLVLFGVWLFYHFAGPYTLKVLNLVFVLVVLNNTYVYVSRRLTGRRYRSPVEYSILLLRKLRFSEKAANLAGFYGTLSLVIVASHFIVGVFS